jgi:glycosyltransferase involved in cell wall biosynthesis
MKILLVTHYYPAHGGGVEIVAGEIAARLTQEHGAQITWCASDTDPCPGSIPGLGCIPMKALNCTERFLGVPYPFWGIGSLNKMRRAIRDSDVVHLHEYAYPGNIAAFIFSRIHKKPVILTQHIGHVSYKNMFFNCLLSLMNHSIGNFILKRAERVIFFSETTKDYFSRFIRFGREPLFIQNGVNTKTFFPVEEPRKAAIREQIEVSKEVPLLLFVGRFVEKKGLPIMKSLAAHFKNVQWIFVGWGPINPESWNLPNVRVYHHMDQAAIAKFYQAADLLVLPSMGEGFPLVVQEAMACGTPVLIGAETARACPAAMPLILSEKVEVKDVAERWSAKIEGLLQNPGRLSEFRPAVAEFCRLRWDWQRCAEGYYRVFIKAWSRA